MVGLGSDQYDAIIVGGGHNGLITAAYLARSGRRTLVLEARESPGGCASTVDALGGARVNICSCDHRTFRTTPVMDELNLEQHGLRYLDVDPAWLNLPDDGSAAWPTFHDIDRTLDALSLLHPAEASNYRRYLDAALPVARLVLAMANETPSPRQVISRLARERATGVATLLKWSRMSVADVLRSFFATEALLAPAVATGPSVWGISPETPGSGLGALSYALGHVGRTGRPVGGSGSLPTSIAKAFVAAGGEIRTGAKVREVRCEGARVRGVTLVDGSEIDAATVVAAADPRTLFLEWLRNPPASAAAVIDRYRAEPQHDGYESKIDAVVGDVPEYRQLPEATAARLGIESGVPSVYVAPPLAAMHDGWLASQQGRVAARPIMFAGLPSVLDPTMRLANGDHVFSLEVLFTPYALAEGWESTKEPERWLEHFSTLVQPGWLGSVKRFRTMTPTRYESEFFMPRGHATGFSGGPLAAFLGRTPELTRYHTPIDGLYVTGGAAFPGAGVWGAPGRNAARVVLAKD